MEYQASNEIMDDKQESVEETLYVDQNAILSASIIKGMKEPYSECSTELDW